MLFLKFGKKEHLQQLKDGVVHFRPLSSFKNDSTHFRGDRLEATLLIDTSYPFIINGMDISPYIKEAAQTFDGFDSILSFSAAKLDHNNCHAIEDGLFTVNDDFIAEMEQFGSHFLIFSAGEFVQGLKESLKKHKCIYSYRSIFYCNKTNHAAISEHFKDTRGIEEEYEYCFVKDYTPYVRQNEWRFIIHDIDGEFQIEDTGGVNIKTNFNTKTPIFETAALKTLQVSEGFLN